MKELCAHLIEKHAVKNVTYIAGAADNPDSIFRMEVLKETLLEHGCSFGEENIYYAKLYFAFTGDQCVVENIRILS